MDKSEIVGIIKLFAGNFCPTGYLYCDGSPLNINTYNKLFDVIPKVFVEPALTLVQLDVPT